ncbi:MAG: ABC transporter substrate-binding protein [Desulfobacterales bacterium]|nr:ABC transporter substrate-binding protein [Desulfobacterales bacterium]
MTNQIKFCLGIIGFIMLLLMLASGNSCTNQNQNEKKIAAEKMTFITVPSMVEVTSHVAYHNKYFEEEGLDINLLFSASGNLSFEKLLNGEADIVTVTETPIVYKSFTRNDFYIIGELVTPVEHQILARKDRGIDSASDLKGKKIAVMRGTSADFFLDSFLIHNGLTHSEVQTVDMLTPEMPLAVEKGEIDAISCWQPFILKAQSRLGNNAIIIPSKNIHTVSWLIVVMRTYAKENPEAIRRFYKAIMKAEKFLTNNREKSIQIHAEMSKTEPFR